MMRGRFLGALSATAMALTLSLTGCGEPAGGETTGGGGSTDSGDAGNEEMALKFAQCMRENGIDMPDPDSEGRIQMRMEGNREQMEKAQQACEEYRPEGPGGQAGPGGDPEGAENMLKFAQCMRENGVEEFPDPDGGMMKMSRDVGEDPDFEAANEKCAEKFLPDGGIGRPGAKAGGEG